ncbi:MAG: hypothetical protein WDZ35_08735 [Crocinitomicaceae bacterium]
MKFGIPYLFLSPEYMGEVSWVSFMILGFSVGGFFMAFHLYSYILLGPSFPFIATLARPFYKFCINNSIIPLAFFITLCVNIYEVQTNEELIGSLQILSQILALTVGILLFIFISVFYFFRTNWDLTKLKLRRKSGRSLYFYVGGIFTKRNHWFDSYHSRAYQPSFYLASFSKVLPARETKHYKPDMLQDVFRQNQLNASIFELTIIVSFFVVGFFGDYTMVQVPSSASIMLLCTFAVMILSIFYSWFKAWAVSLIVVTLVMINAISAKSDFFQIKNYAYGLNYSQKQPYNIDYLRELQYDTITYRKDVEHHEKILKHWYETATMLQETEKPKLVLLNCSGGGLRSAMWTFYILQQLDENSDKEFFKNVHFITGASGGMVGASYYRELELMSQKDSTVNPLADRHLKNISKDLLNSVAFNLVMHDVFMRFKKETINGQTYVQDRGFSFEAQLNQNTEHVLDKRMIDYRRPEQFSQTPLMLFSPTIINDGRRMLIGSQPYGFMNGKIDLSLSGGPENVEFIKLFKPNFGQSVKLTSVLRMNSTFPYILPMVTLPTKPEIQVMDAGIRDNYGTKSTVRYIQAMEDWLVENTSGIVVVEIRDIQKDYDIQEKERMTLTKRFMRPISNFYGNYHHSQEFNSTELIDAVNQDKLPVEVITFVLRKDPSEMISLSWHLTQREKNDIRRIFNNDYNQNQMNILIDLLNHTP